MTYPNFKSDIDKMNALYELPVIKLWTEMVDRLPKFQDILSEECSEITEVSVKLYEADDDNGATVMADARVMMADLLGDIIVYCASEALRWGIPIDKTLEIIMASNFSKLGEDGRPIKDERGKFLKGPNYWKPEEKIKEMLVLSAAIQLVAAQPDPVESPGPSSDNP